MSVQLSGEYSPHMDFNGTYGHVVSMEMYRNTL